MHAAHPQVSSGGLSSPFFGGCQKMHGCASTMTRFIMEATWHLVKDSGLRVQAATGQNADKLAELFHQFSGNKAIHLQMFKRSAAL